MPEVFAIAPASAKPIWFLAGICVLLFVIAGALAYTAYSARHSRVEIGDGELRLAGDFWGRSIPVTSVRVEHAAVLNLRNAPDFAPRIRTLGTAVPGYASGWYRLRNGEKALAYLTRRDSVVYLPTALGYSLLLSVSRPEELLAALRSEAGR